MASGWDCVSNPQADWNDIAGTAESVRAAMAKTLPVLNRQELLAAIEEARAVDGSLYTPESYGIPVSYTHLEDE